MNSLEDLVRDALAERAHDVDGLDLTTFDARPAARRRRWVAVGTVVAVAAALVVAVVLVAPWRGAPHRNATPAAIPSPPTGMQWVSYHGITLTVPASWKLDPATICAPPASDSVFVAHGSSSIASCPAHQGPPQLQTTSVVSLRPFGSEGAAGTRFDIDGHPAYRDDSPLAAGDPVYSWPITTVIGLPDVGIAVTVDTVSEAELQRVIGGIEYTPVDHLGCAAHRSGAPNLAADGGQPAVPGPGPIVVCQYEPTSNGPDDHPAVSALLGSRVLTADETAALRAFVTRAAPGAPRTPTPANSPDDGVRAFLLPTADRTPAALVADPSSGAVLVSDGHSTAVVPDSSGADLPNAYP